jgi:hypothetical protein
MFLTHGARLLGPLHLEPAMTSVGCFDAYALKPLARSFQRFRQL